MDVFTALDDPIRRELLRRLASGAERVVDLAAEHDVSRPAISRHLRVLREAGLVTGTDRGRERHYALDPAPLVAVVELIETLTATRRPPVEARHLDALDTEVRRTVRERRRDTATPPQVDDTKENTA